MNKNLFALITLSVLGFILNCQAEDITEIMRDGYVTKEIPEIELKAEDDVLDASTEVKPLTTRMSKSEQMQESNSDLDYIEEDVPLPDLPCDSPNLKKQVEAFMLNNLNMYATNSVIEKRNRILMLKNLPDFVDVTGEKIDSKANFQAASADAYLRINEKRKILHVCKSSNMNKAYNLKDVYVIIYPYLEYYKVVVANAMNSIEDMDKSTFIYNW